MEGELQELRDRLHQLEMECGIAQDWPTHATFHDWLSGMVDAHELTGAERILYELWESIDIDDEDEITELRRAANGSGGTDDK